jgi:hypothetical protein
MAPLTVDGGGDDPGPSSGLGEFDCCGLLRLERDLEMMYFGLLGIEGYSLTDELVLPLGSPVLSVNLLKWIHTCCSP